MTRFVLRAICRFVVFAGLIAVAASPACADWHEFRVTFEPTSPTDEDTIDFETFRWFGDPGFNQLEQSISINANQIDLEILIQDLHSGPWFFAQVVTPHRASFDDVGPLAAGQYQVTARMWSTPWPATSGGTLLDTASLSLTVSETFVPLPYPGDYNRDGVVDAGDYTVWRDMDGQSGPGLAADGDGNGTVDVADYEMWKAHLGLGAGGGSDVNASHSPEPHALLLAIAAAAMACLARRR